ncbi:MAG: primary-amine oxidase [Agriterribacter sp.]
MIEVQSATAVRHPLEPLTADEIKIVVDTLRGQKNLGKSIRFISVSLKEPAKEIVYNYHSYGTISREAFVVLFDNDKNECYETTVSIDKGMVISWKHIPGVQPTMSSDEQIECEQAVLASPAFKAALEQYGITDMSLVMVDIWSAGYYGSEEEKNLRLARPLCFVRSEPGDNGYARPIEGVRPVVNLNTMEVIRVEDYGYTPLPPNAGNYAASLIKNMRTDIKPIDIIQPEGPSFTVNGYEVSWQKWNFVIGFNPREGLTLHTLNYNDNGEKRSVLYRVSLSEMVVPYGDPTDTQKRKNAFDSGEYGMGTCANSLELGCDCLGYIKYFDANMTDSKGNLLTIKNAICMHEEDYGILWKHTDRRLGKPEVRRSRRLVISSVSTVENYEYGFFWYLYQDGNIQLEVKLTGILSLGAYMPGVKPKYGNMVAPQLYAPNHQHFFNVRCDFDLNGQNNAVYEVDIVPEEIDDNNPYQNAFYAKSTLLENEKQARSNLNLDTSRYWKIVNHNRKNHVGESVAYKFMGGDNCKPFASPNAYWRKRAGFVENHVWVTPYNEEEMFGAGNYPNQSQGGDGLIKWTAQNRTVKDTDIVLWYTMGHTHIPRPEDYPVMPTAYIGFLLKPLGFFNENPANDVPPSPSKAAASNGKSCCH